MSKYANGIAVIMFVFILSGCNMDRSMNVQKSVIRGTGDVSATLVLEKTQLVDVEQRKIQMDKAATIVIETLEKDAIYPMTIDELRAKLRAKLPIEFWSYIDEILAYVERIKPSEYMSQTVIDRLLAYAKGFKIGTNEYNIKYR
ncbi:MAG: hypothetical protein AABY32_02210 [Nanoarchaeota archaeon]